MAKRLSAKADAVASVRQRMRAAAYSLGGVDWEKLFLQYDKSGDGGLQLSELQSAVRRVLKRDLSCRERPPRGGNSTTSLTSARLHTR